MKVVDFSFYFKCASLILNLVEVRELASELADEYLAGVFGHVVLLGFWFE